MNSITFTPAFQQSRAVAPPPKVPKTQGEIFKEKTKKEAEIAKQKPASERNVGDYISIGMDTIDKFTETPVLYANSAQKLNYVI